MSEKSMHNTRSDCCAIKPDKRYMDNGPGVQFQGVTSLHDNTHNHKANMTIHSRDMIGRDDRPNLEICTLATELSSLCLNLDSAVNCHPGVSQAGRGINVCAAPRSGMKLHFPFADIRWWMLKISWCPL